MAKAHKIAGGNWTIAGLFSNIYLYTPILDGESEAMACHNPAGISGLDLKPAKLKGDLKSRPRILKCSK